jgi:hypothetical protein
VRMNVSSWVSYANLARLPRGVSTTTCTSPSSVKGGKLMKFGMARVQGVRVCSAARVRVELTPRIAVSCQMVPRGRNDA